MSQEQHPREGTAVYLCNCGTNIAERLDTDEVRRRIEQHPGVRYVRTIEFACSEPAQEEISREIAERGPARCVFAACSPREHEETFRRVTRQGGLNPYLMQLTNVREHVAWVTEDRDRATDKATGLVRAALERVARQAPLDEVKVDAASAALVIGAGPSGMKAALQLAEAGRKVTLVERTGALGGMPVLFEEVFPGMECGPCLVEPLMAEVLHGPHAANIELLTLAEVTRVKGFHGNFLVEVRQAPRFVTDACLGCGECSAACPVSEPDPVNLGRGERRAMSFPFAGSLPHVPRLLEHLCVRFTRGEECRACEAACPMPGVVDLGDGPRTIERKVGAIVLAVGADLYDSGRLPALGHGRVPEVVDALEFERLCSATGPGEGRLLTRAGQPPRSVAIVHCVGSLDERHCAYCSGVCCGYAFKFNHIIRHKVPGARVVHLYKQLSLAGRDEHRLFDEARASDGVELHRYQDIDEITVTAGAADDGQGAIRVSYPREGAPTTEAFDMVVLCPAMVPRGSSAALGTMVDVRTGTDGFYRELHSRIDAARSPVKGVYLAGTCQAPMDIQRSVNMAAASVGYILSSLVEGRQLEVPPIAAAVEDERCSGCRTCMTVCPYRAITFDEQRMKASVSRLLCMGCGTCVAGCPSGALRGDHFTNDAILAEIAGALS